MEKKEFIDLKEAIFSYDNDIILIKIKEGKSIISVKCSKNIYNETTFFLDNRLKIRNTPDYVSKRDLFFKN